MSDERFARLAKGMAFWAGVSILGLLVWSSFPASAGEGGHSSVADSQSARVGFPGCTDETCWLLNVNVSSVNVDGTVDVENGFVIEPPPGMRGGTITSEPMGISCPGFEDDGSGSFEDYERSLVESGCGMRVPNGEQVQLTATPDVGWKFDGWRNDSGSCDGSLQPTCVMSDLSWAASATFRKLPRQTSIMVQMRAPRTMESVRVRSLPAGIECGILDSECVAEYEPGTTVTLVADLNNSRLAEFVKWSGDCSGSGTCSLLMGGYGKAMAQVYAHFARAKYASLEATLRKKLKVSVSRGRGVKLSVPVVNGGTADAENVKVCAAGPRRLVSVSGCVRLDVLAAGASNTVSFKIKARKQARKGSTVQIAFTGQAKTVGKFKMASASLKIK